MNLLELFLLILRSSEQLFMGQPFLPWGQRGDVCYCGWTLEGSVKVSVLCRLSCCCCWDWCCWWCDWGKVLCCSGNAAERISWVEGFPWSNLEVCKNCCGGWFSWAWDGCWTDVSCCSWELCCCCCCCCVTDNVCDCCCCAAKVG